MKWNQLISPFIARSQIHAYTRQLSPSSRLHVLLSGSKPACTQCQKMQDCNLNRLIPPINRQSLILSHYYFPWHVTCIWSRGYAKGKDKGRDKKKTDKGKKKIDINEEQLAEVIKLDAMKTQMQKALDDMKEDFVKNLSLRSTTGSIETLPISFEGKDYELQELGQILRKNPKTLIVNMSSFPQTIPSVLLAIQKSGLNLNPQQDGTTLFIPIPKVTKEHRESLAKNAKTLFVKCKDSVRDAQNKYIKTVKNNSKLSEDLSFSAQEQITAIADHYISEGMKLFETKQTELIGKD